MIGPPPMPVTARNSEFAEDCVTDERGGPLASFPRDWIPAHPCEGGA